VRGGKLLLAKNFRHMRIFGWLRSIQGSNFRHRWSFSKCGVSVGCFTKDRARLEQVETEVAFCALDDLASSICTGAATAAERRFRCE
jgi:hypothetical protein